MKVVSKKNPRRLARPSRAHGLKIVKKTSPMSAEEMTRLIEKARLETDPVKISEITDQIVDGFYGRKTVVV